MLVIIICILMIIIGLIFMPSKEERNRKKYDEGVHKGHRYTNVDDLKSDYYVINRCWNEDQEKLKKQKK